MLKKSGYGKGDITVFMVCNWKRTYNENLQKMDLCKVWNVKIADCWFDNQTPPDIKPIHWTEQEIKDFRKKCRKHNQLVNFGIDPELNQLKKAKFSIVGIPGLLNKYGIEIQ